MGPRGGSPGNSGRGSTSNLRASRPNSKSSMRHERLWYDSSARSAGPAAASSRALTKGGTSSSSHTQSAASTRRPPPLLPLLGPLPAPPLPALPPLLLASAGEAAGSRQSSGAAAASCDRRGLAAMLRCRAGSASGRSVSNVGSRSAAAAARPASPVPLPSSRTERNANRVSRSAAAASKYLAAAAAPSHTAQAVPRPCKARAQGGGRARWQVVWRQGCTGRRRGSVQGCRAHLPALLVHDDGSAAYREVPIVPADRARAGDSSEVAGGGGGGGGPAQRRYSAVGAMRHVIPLPVAVDGARQGKHRRSIAVARHGLLAAGERKAVLSYLMRCGDPVNCIGSGDCAFGTAAGHSGMEPMCKLAQGAQPRLHLAVHTPCPQFNASETSRAALSAHTRAPHTPARSVRSEFQHAGSSERHCSARRSPAGCGTPCRHRTPPRRRSAAAPLAAPAGASRR